MFFAPGFPSTATSAMYPSRFKIFAMLSRMLECAIDTSGNNAMLALRMRVSMSAMGSVILPARFRYARDEAIERGFTESETRAGELAEIPAAAAAHRAAIHQ